jgi:hypothetical protein
MGTTYFVANTTKKQYFDPDIDGSENTKRKGVLWGLSGHALGQLLLPGAKLDFHLEPWIGDSLVLVGDQAEPNSIELLRPFQLNPDQDAYHIVTEQFDNITINLIAYMCKSDAIRDRLLENAAKQYWTLINLAHAVFYMGAPHIEQALVERFGDSWTKRYQEALRQHGALDCTLPLTPDNKRRGQVLDANVVSALLKQSKVP